MTIIRMLLRTLCLLYEFLTGLTSEYNYCIPVGLLKSDSQKRQEKARRWLEICGLFWSFTMVVWEHLHILVHTIFVRTYFSLY